VRIDARIIALAGVRIDFLRGARVVVTRIGIVLPVGSFHTTIVPNPV
jgi:hypothetical protein